MPDKIRAYACRVPNAPWMQSDAIYNAVSRGAAKRAYHLDIRECWPDVPYTAIRCRIFCDLPITTKMLRHVAEYRGVPHVEAGTRVTLKGTEAAGTIVDAAHSCNFRVLFDSDSPMYPGETLAVHPDGMEFEDA